MDKIEKLLRKISRADRERLLFLIERLLAADTKGLNIEKIKKTDLYRLRSGRFRIIFHREDGEVVVDSIRLRNERTYKK
ncbi:MAG: hypothetical protein COV60_00825 [Candidatus Magasanikbacteria bacterium CG11_big_fil_rev_8_21_14_0_20_43_7]|uniref:Plasmid stabilization protein n=1 Tax=Candidatus Magasanikbacteria bacterium CG11_big_fil_rev_8_21_14_0_20_43_7 TaxID=1974654 RepID=A0A2H0N363_9BACT|nr:MAG: hypothetical protein COV60_00825 [Candidatus Magasanikbacteria bacterium CG11_big_fil_rev_8_21_14_0_20_43_7]